jgi:ubiquitin-like-conjugating enzyme ATG10
MAGCVTWKEFNRCITQILTISDRLADGWTLHNKDAPEGAYLAKRIFVSDTDHKSAERPEVLAWEEPEPVGDILEDVNAISGSGGGMLTWEYHVLYSHSYSVPVLYFNAWINDGRLLSLEDVWCHVHASFQDSLQENRWSVLTQQEHPVLRRPFYMLHPCCTAELLSCLQEHSANIVVTWLSTVGPVVGLTLCPQYAEITAVE